MTLTQVAVDHYVETARRCSYYVRRAKADGYPAIAEEYRASRQAAMKTAREFKKGERDAHASLNRG